MIDEEDNQKFPPQLEQFKKDCSSTFDLGALQSYIQCYSAEEFLKFDGLTFDV